MHIVLSSGILPTLISALFALILVVGVPALSYSTAQNSEIQTMPRLTLYLSAVCSQWILTLLGFGVTLLAAPKIFIKGFGTMPLFAFLEWGTGVAAIAILALGAVISAERHSWLPQESDLVYRLVPETSREKLWAVLIVAPTAAFCEEFLFRGYLLTQFLIWFHSPLWALVVSSIAFAFAHFYQGRSGMTRAGLLGALLAYPVVKWGSLYPAMLAHWMIDAVALLWLGSWMVRKDSSGDTHRVDRGRDAGK